MKRLVLFAAMLALVGGGYVAYYTYQNAHESSSPDQKQSYANIETYIRTAISHLSPTKEQVGGTFYVTAIEINGSAGVVNYEDGHNAYTADFAYHITAEGEPVVDSFVIRP